MKKYLWTVQAYTSLGMATFTYGTRDAARWHHKYMKQKQSDGGFWVIAVGSVKKVHRP